MKGRDTARIFVFAGGFTIETDMRVGRGRTLAPGHDGRFRVKRKGLTQIL